MLHIIPGPLAVLPTTLFPPLVSGLYILRALASSEIFMEGTKIFSDWPKFVIAGTKQHRGRNSTLALGAIAY